jgi:transcriptional regulator with XRE-family HTH domain
MGRRPKKPSEDVFTELEKVNPKAAYMKKKCCSIGKNIREHRRQRRFSVENLAEYLELSESYIGLLERGDRCPSLKIVYKLCDLYGIMPNDLLTTAPDNHGLEMNIAEDRAAYNAKMQAEAVVSLIRTLTESEMEFVIETIKNVRKIGK